MHTVSSHRYGLSLENVFESLGIYMPHQAIAPEDIKQLTVREFIDASMAAGVRPSELLTGRGLLHDASIPER